MRVQQRRKSIAADQEHGLLQSAQSHYGSTTDHTRSSSPEQKVHTSPVQRALQTIYQWIGHSGIIVKPEWRQSRVLGSRAWWQEIIPGDAMVLPLLIVTFSCALGDAVTYKYYQVFATSQTGNTVLLAVAAVGSSSKSPLLAIVSLGGFVVFGLLFGQLGGYYGHRRRSWLIFSFIAQLATLAISAVLVSHGPPSFQPHGQFEWVYMLLLSIQGGPQVTMATNAGTREIPTAMMTTPYAAFLSDPSLFAPGAVTDVQARNRRAIYIAVFWAGCFVGAAIARWSSLLVMTLAVIGLKILAMLVVLFSAGEEGSLLEADGGSLWQEHPERGEAGDRVRDEQFVTM